MHGKLLVNLCLSLLGIYVMFVVASLMARTPRIPCALAGAVLQYFLLVTFAIMAAEAISLYINLVVVLGWNTVKHRYALKTTLVAWSKYVYTPALDYVVIVCFFVYNIPLQLFLLLLLCRV